MPQMRSQHRQQVTVRGMVALRVPLVTRGCTSTKRIAGYLLAAGRLLVAIDGQPGDQAELGFPPFPQFHKAGQEVSVATPVRAIARPRNTRFRRSSGGRLTSPIASFKITVNGPTVEGSGQVAIRQEPRDRLLYRQGAAQMCRLFLGLALGLGIVQESAEAALTTFQLPGAPSTGAFGLNDAGYVVGSVGLDAFIMAPDGSWNIYRHPNVPEGGGSTFLAGINGANQIVGSYHVSGQPGSASFIMQPDGTLTEVSVPGALRTIAYKLNDSGAVVGSYATAGEYAVHAFLYEDGTYRTFPELAGHANLFFSDISNLGIIAGGYYEYHPIYESVAHGLLYDSRTGSITLFDVPGAVRTFIYCINDSGQIAGRWDDAYGRSHGFVSRLDGTEFLDVLLPGADSVQFFDINNQGWVVGQMGYYTPDGHRVAGLVGTPEGIANVVVPQPRTPVCLLSLALEGCLWAVGRRWSGRSRPLDPRPCGDGASTGA